MVLKTPSPYAKFRSSEALPVDRRVVAKLAQRVLADHRNTSFFVKAGIPENMVLLLYEDIFALTTRLVLDVALTFEFRCLGHSLKIAIEADEDLHNAPGWDVALDRGSFGRFDS